VTATAKTSSPAAIGAAERVALRRARRRHRLRANGVAYAFLAPSLVFFALFLLLPVAWVVRQSFLAGGVLGEAQWVGLDNWRQAPADPALRRALANTVQYAAMTVPTVLALALVIALLLRGVRRGGAVIRAAVYFPSLAPVVLAAVIWIFMVQPDFGLLNLANRTLGLSPLNFLGDQALALPTIALMDIWRGMGFWALVLLAALIAVPTALYQAAAIDGATPWRRFLHVTLPGIRPTLIVTALLATVLSLQVFDSVYMLTSGGPAGATQTAVFYVYTSVFETGNPGYGAVLSLVLLAVIVAITGVFVRLVGRMTR
jgi:multiple sugar transport system permease protein